METQKSIKWLLEIKLVELPAWPRSWQRAEEHQWCYGDTNHLKMLTMAFCAPYLESDHYEEPKHYISHGFNRSSQILFSLRKKIILLVHQICYYFSLYRALPMTLI